jgi:hypothetical protein
MNQLAVATQPQAAQKPMTPGGALAAFVPQDSAQLLKLADVLSRSGDMVPKQFHGNAPAITAAIMRGMEIGLNPMQALSSIAVINGRATVWGDALPALVQRAGHHVDVDYEGQGDSLTAVATLTRSDGRKVVRRFGMADAKRAGLLGKQGPWTQYTSRMLAHRARTWAIRDGAADALMGLQVTEEVQDYGPDHAREVNPQAAPAPRRGGVVYADADVVDEIHDGEVLDTATLPAPTDEEIQRQINEDHAREMARLDEQP